MTVTADQLVEQNDGPGPLEGAGALSDLSDLRKSGSAGETAANGVAFGLSALGYVKDPIESALSAGVGWLIEHLAILREPLDALAGDPGEVEAHGKTWQNVSKQLDASAAQRLASLTGLTSWDGAARAAYQTAAVRQVEQLREASKAADQLAGQVLKVGAVIGTVRSLIRDTIADFVAKVLEHAVVAALAAPASAGASVAAFLVDLAIQVTALLSKISKKLAELLEWLAESARVLAGLAGRMDDLARGLGKVGARPTPTLDAAGEHVRNVAREHAEELAQPSGLPRDAVVESWKQYEKSEATASEWVPL